MTTRLRLTLLALPALLLVGCASLGWQAALAPITPPAPGSFAPALVAQGGRLAAAGNCIGCHTVAGGPALAGGLGLDTGFGQVFSTNISPEPATGIGAWSLPAFGRALREGVSRDGTQLLPAFPYTHFTRLTDADVAALYAWLMSQAPVVAPARANTLRFPFNLRALQAGWKLLYFDPGTYTADASRSAEWNRGTYLAEGLTHCGACHTPRNSLGAELAKRAYAGAPYQGWLAPPLDVSNPAPVPWTQQDLADYLRHGESEAHGAAAGVMASVVHQGLAPLPDADVMALATYFADLNQSASRAASTAPALAQAAARRLVDAGRETEPGANLYLAGCASCHYSPAGTPLAVQGSLSLSTALTAANPANFHPDRAARCGRRRPARPLHAGLCRCTG